jgi:hypothetical protein
VSFLDALFSRAPTPQGLPQSAATVRNALLAINRPSAPFQVRLGEVGEAELVAEWGIVDVRWYEIFAKAGLEKAFKVLMRLDEAAHELRALVKNGRWNGERVFRN